MTRPLKTLFGIAGVVLSLPLSGCWTPSYYVDVYLSPLLKETYKVYPSVELDLVGADRNDAERLDSCDIDTYFDVGDPLRMSTPHATIRFTETDILPKSLSTWDAIWDIFDDKDADKLYVLVNLPQMPPKPGAKKAALPTKDGRRIVLPLESKNWFLQLVWPFYYRVHRLEISPAGVNVIGSEPDGAPDLVKVRSKIDEED